MRSLGWAVLLSGAVASGLQCNQAPPTPDNPPTPSPDSGIVTQSVPPPPISGGTLLMSSDGKTAIVSDPDRDFVSFVDVDRGVVRVRTDLDAHDEPGRVAEDESGNVYVALRGTGELATFSLATGALLGRRFACNEPRGVAYDATHDRVLVACATGELVTMASGVGAAVSATVVERDMRDLVLVGDRLFVSKFRHAEVIELGPDRKVIQRIALPTNSGGHAAMAWRMRMAGMLPPPDGGMAPSPTLLLTYQIHRTESVSTTTNSYGTNSSGGGGIVTTALAVISIPPIDAPGTAHAQQAAIPAVLPVDFAVTPTQGAVWVAAAGNVSPMPSSNDLALPTGLVGPTQRSAHGQFIAVDVRGDDLLAQSREPAQLWILGPFDSAVKVVDLSTVSRIDTGHAIFHASSGKGIACASCHGEGGDDAQTWNFDGVRARRTPSLRGTVKGTAPYHWDADFPDLTALTQEVYTQRMGGRELDAPGVEALKNWLEQIPRPRRPSVDEAARSRGEALFNASDCRRCHAGPRLTNNETIDVGSGVPMQVPSLIGVGARLPVMHDGCAATLAQRFDTCANPMHGKTASLTPSEIADLVTFLDSL